MKEEESGKRRISPANQAAIGFGYQFTAAIIVCAGLGYYLDHRRGGEGIAFTLGGLFLGLFYGGYELWKIIRRMEEKGQESDRP